MQMQVLMNKCCGSWSGYCYAFEEARTDPFATIEDETTCHELLVRVMTNVDKGWHRCNKP